VLSEQGLIVYGAAAAFTRASPRLAEGFLYRLGNSIVRKG